MTKHKYFDSTGTEIDESSALRDGVLRDGCTMRTSMTLRDAAMARQQQASTNKITDGRTNDPTALNRPGYRIPVVNDRRATRDAYASYETGLVNAYRCGDGEVQCPTCYGEGVDADGKDCDDCNGTGLMPEPDAGSPSKGSGGSRYGSGNGFGSGDDPDMASDHRALDAATRQRQAVDQAYQSYDADLAQAYRRNG